MPIPKDITASDVLRALDKLDSGTPHPFHEPTKYELVREGKSYAPKAVIGLAADRALGRMLNPDEFSSGQGPGQAVYVLRKLGFTVVEQDRVQAEIDRRQAMMAELAANGGPRNVKPGLLRELGIYSGQAGIYRDIGTTRAITGGRAGVAVTFYPLGRRYPDDLQGEWLMYHYPVTGRAGITDEAEVESGKAAARFAIPIFVVTPSENAADSRDVCWGCVVGWDDDQACFRVRLGQDASKTPDPSPPIPLQSLFIGKRPSKRQEIERRERSPVFRYEVLQRFGTQCAVCPVNTPQLLDAAHVIPVSKNGSDAAVNGLPLCALHHRAFDAGLFVVDPDSLQLAGIAGGPTLEALRVTQQFLRTKKSTPDKAALEWRRTEMRPGHGTSG